jgi:hypothetical protein
MYAELRYPVTPQPSISIQRAVESVTIVAHWNPGWRAHAKETCEMTPDRYMSSSVLAYDFRSWSYRESVMYNQNIPTNSE